MFLLNTSFVQSLISLVEVLLLLVPTLLSVAFVTVAERKTMASMQRRLGPNTVGYYGLLQAFADALKLLLKEYVSPTQANLILFFLGPIVTLMFSLLGFSVIPYAPGITISDFNLGILYMLAMSSLSTYGILLAGWSANSKYAFLGSLRSTAQLISYELILSSAILLVILFSGSLNLGVNVETQRAVWYILPLFPVFVIFFIGSIAETNRAPFDLVEAESELVSGFMTEHAAVIFVFFFLAEYASILLICILTAMLFTGGYLFDSLVYNIVYYLYYLTSYMIELITFTIVLVAILFKFIYSIINYIWLDLIYIINNPRLLLFELNTAGADYWVYRYLNNLIISMEEILLEVDPEDTGYLVLDIIHSDSWTEGVMYSIVLGVKSSIMIFIFIWARASLPRIRYDQLMSYCWTILLPLIIALIILFPCILYSFEILPSNISLL